MSTPANVKFPTGDVLTYSHDGYPDAMEEVIRNLVESAEQRDMDFKDALTLEIMEASDGAYGPNLTRRGNILPRAHFEYKVTADGEIIVIGDGDRDNVPIEEYEGPY